MNKASTQVENISGPILLFSGLDHEVWPSAMMSDMIENRIKNSHFNFTVENIKYENAGHLISNNSNNPSSIRNGKMMIDGKSYDFNFGGNEQGDRTAQKDASKKVFQFLSKIKNE